MRFALLGILVFVLACSDSAEVAKEAPALNVANLPPPPSGHLKGEVRVSSALAARVAPGDTIYLMARNAATGGIVAVRKLTAPAQFPLTFELTGEHVMMPGGSLSGKLRLSARLDKDGNATTKLPGDLTAELAEPVDVPGEGIALTLDQAL